jgi:hypothetical protein
VRLTGGIILDQDGVFVRFRKRRLTCGCADTTLTTARIPTGSLSADFYCPKCRKSQRVDIQGAG